MNRPTKITVCVLMLIVAAALIIMNAKRPKGAARHVNSVYFMDVSTGNLFAASALDISPGVTPDTGTPAVRAYVYSCGECTPDERQVAYLLKVSDKVKSKLAAMDLGARGDRIKDFLEVPDPTLWTQGSILVADPKTKEWVSSTSVDGEDLMDSGSWLCAGDRVGRTCNP